MSKVDVLCAPLISTLEGITLVVDEGKKRSRRLRKKLHVGEFKEFYFEFDAELGKPLAPEEANALVDAFLSELIEPRKLGFTGWVKGGCIDRYGSGSVTEEDRLAVESWLLARSEYSSVRVGPLKDAWYS